MRFFFHLAALASEENNSDPEASRNRLDVDWIDSLETIKR